MRHAARYSSAALPSSHEVLPSEVQAVELRRNWIGRTETEASLNSASLVTWLIGAKKFADRTDLRRELEKIAADFTPSIQTLWSQATDRLSLLRRMLPASADNRHAIGQWPGDKLACHGGLNG